MAFTHYVEGELTALSDPAAAVAADTAAVDVSRASGAGIVEGIATVGLAAVWTSQGNAEAAARGYLLLLDYWDRTGSATQLWTTVRGVARLLADHGRDAQAALLLAAADLSPAAAALTGEDAVHTDLFWSRLENALSSAGLVEIRSAAVGIGRSRPVEVARQVLAAFR